MTMNSVKVNYIAVGITLGAVLIIMMRMYYMNRIPDLKGVVNLKEVLSVSIDLAERGGKETVLVKKEHKDLNAEKKGLTKEGATELKTNGDMRSHRAIIAGFQSVFPELSHRIVSEEHDKKPVAESQYVPSKKLTVVSTLPDEKVDVKDITIWIDPLDATQEYTENLDQYVTVMICVAVKGKPILGVINRPIDTEIYKHETVWAWDQKGTSTNLALSTNKDIPTTPNVIISRSHAGEAKAKVQEAFGGGTVISAGGAGYKTIEVVRGTADVYAHVTLIKKWDICAGNALLNAVGGQMKTLSNEDIDYSKEGSAANEKGLLAALYNFDHYMKKLGPVFLKSKSEQ